MEFNLLEKLAVLKAIDEVIQMDNTVKRGEVRFMDRLADAIKQVLGDAIERGGTTLRDFLNESGQPGYFAQELMVYGRAGEPCKRCGGRVATRQIGQRASAYCPNCQR